MKRHLPSEKKAEANLFSPRLLQLFYSSVSAGRVITVDTFAKFNFIWQLTDLRCILTSSDSFFPSGLQLLFKCQTWAAAGVLLENSHSLYKQGRHLLPDARQFSLLAFSTYKLIHKILPFNIYCPKLFATIRFRSSNSIGGGADTAENWTRWVKRAGSQVGGTKPTSDWKKERRAKRTVAFSGRSNSTSSLVSKHLAMTQGFCNPILKKSPN